ncbi:MAG: FtsX-like permease family protein [Chloroflexota bacterium]
MTQNKGRSGLVVLSIVLGVFAIGLTMGARSILMQGMSTSYTESDPPAFWIGTAEPFGPDFVERVINDPAVENASGRRQIELRYLNPNGSWQDMRLYTLEPAADQQVSRIVVEEGTWPPQKGQLFIERHGIGMVGLEQGETLILEAANGIERELTIVGTTHDVVQFASGLSGLVYGYVNVDTLDSFDLPQPHLYSELHVTLAENQLDPAHIEAVLAHVEDLIEESGMTVTYINQSPTPGEHGAQPVVNSIGQLLVFLGILTLVLATFLISNTMSALMARQIKEIGIMKTVGASRWQLIGMFLLIPATYGGLALLFALPLAVIGARFLAVFVLGIVNFDAASLALPIWLWGLQIGLGMLVPLVAGLLPIMTASNTSVREAVDNMVIKSGNQDGLISRLFLLVVDRWLQLSRPLIISLQNTFRRRGRLIFTLIALTLGSAIFMAVSTLQRSTNQTLSEIAAFRNHDLQITLQYPERTQAIAQLLTTLPEVDAIEGWVGSGARVVQEGVDGITLGVTAIPADSDLIAPTLVAGRWLDPAGSHEVVVNADLLRFLPDLSVGETLRLDIEGKESDWLVVGIINGQLDGERVYLDYHSYVERFGGIGKAEEMVIQGSGILSQVELALLVEETLRDANIAVNSIVTTARLQDGIRFQFGIVNMLLTVMSILITAVGGFGLAGTMGMNVMERMREIGVLRSIGADTRAILQIVVIEGVVIGLISWSIGGLLSYPIGRFLSTTIGVTLIEAPLSHSFSYQGVGLWFVVVVFLSAAASAFPAYRAAQLEVREALAHV